MGLRHVLAAGLAAASLGAAGPAAADEPLLCLVMGSRDVAHITVRPVEVCVLAP